MKYFLKICCILETSFILSTREQHLDRGIAEINTYCEQNQLELEKIFTDQQTGKNLTDQDEYSGPLAQTSPEYSS